MERFINENFHDDSKDWELLDTTTGDANPRACLSQRNLAKEKYYPKGIAFLQKKGVIKLIEGWQFPEKMSAHMFSTA